MQRETPIYALEVPILSAGGVFGYDGPKSLIDEKEATHIISDRTKKSESSNDQAVPQWIFDCLNVSKVIPCLPYLPGKVI